MPQTPMMSQQQQQQQQQQPLYHPAQHATSPPAASYSPAGSIPPGASHLHTSPMHASPMHASPMHASPMQAPPMQAPPMGLPGMPGMTATTAGPAALGPPPTGGYAAYPEGHPSHQLPRNVTYQQSVRGLSGWNDPPSAIAGGAGLKAAAAVVPGGRGIDPPAVFAQLRKRYPDQEPRGFVMRELHDALARIKEAAAAPASRERFTPQMDRQIADTERRQEALIDILAGEGVTDLCLANLVRFAMGLRERQWDEAQQAATALAVGSQTSQFEGGQWIVGIKRLMELMRTYSTS
ncbi:hypothetical protein CAUPRSCDRAFT_11680 [Caulochytrium protostelioides]|nr:hypothetical protein CAUPRSCDRAFT_11680 [Caulochytrium protostelioides]